MEVKSIIRIIILGGTGSLIIGIGTGKWFQGILFCLIIASIGEYVGMKKRRKKS